MTLDTRDTRHKRELSTLWHTISSITISILYYLILQHFTRYVTATVLREGRVPESTLPKPMSQDTPAITEAREDEVTAIDV